jgi:DNA modification methylase
MASDWRILTGDVLDILRTLPDESVHCCVTSPPYWGLRDYGVAGQIGLEATPEAYVERMVEVFREVRRVLRNDGTLWLNLGDSYSTHPPVPGQQEQQLNGQTAKVAREVAMGRTRKEKQGGLPEKNLLGVPWRVAFALQADGWWLRSDIIWAKPNPMPESVTDRPTRSHEYIFLLTKSSKYYYDAEAIKEPLAEASLGRAQRFEKAKEKYGSPERPNSKHRTGGVDQTCAFAGLASGRSQGYHIGGRNKRDVWFVSTKPYKGSHFATFPPDLIEPCVLAGAPAQACPICGAPWERVTEKGDLIPTGHGGSKKWTEVVKQYRGEKSTETSTFATRAIREKVTVGWQPTCSCPDNNGSGKGVVLDPFCGSGTTGVVALRHGRKFIGVELNPTYVEMAERRIIADAPLLNSEVM